MKTIKYLTAIALATSFLSAPLVVLAADSSAEKVKPYTLETCPVSGDKLGEMGKPFSFNYEGREIKLCCKNCKKDFDKDPAKFIKKIEEGEKAAESKDAGKNHEGHKH